jgi:isoamylase
MSWLSWNFDERQKALLEFTSNLVALRKAHPNLHRRKFFQDRKISPASVANRQVDGLEVRDITWYRPDGQQMTEEEWQAGWVRCLGLCLSGRTLDDVDRNGQAITDDSFLLCFNPHHKHIQFYLPACAVNHCWQLLLDTRDPISTEARTLQGGKPYDMLEHSAVLFCEVKKAGAP